MVEKSTYAENQLFTKISEGDELAFKELFHLYVPQLRPTMLKIVHTESNVKDIIQELFLDLWLDRHKLSDISDPRGWIFTMAYHLSYKVLRKQASLDKALKNNTSATVSNSENDIEATLSFRETVKHLNAAIKALPDQSRRIYELNRNQGLKITEIATQLDINAQSVKNSLYRSSQFIKTYLTNRGIHIPMSLMYFLLQ